MPENTLFTVLFTCMRRLPSGLAIWSSNQALHHQQRPLSGPRLNLLGLTHMFYQAKDLMIPRDQPRGG